MGKRRQPERRQPWWQQIPTWLTAIAAFITAFGGAWAVFGQLSSPPSTPTTTTSTALPSKDPGKFTYEMSTKLHRNKVSYDVKGEWRPVSSYYDVVVVARPKDGQSQGVFSKPAQVKPDGSWTATLTIAKTQLDKVVISVKLLGKEGKLPQYMPLPAPATQ